jgi:hypothetical protein
MKLLLILSTAVSLVAVNVAQADVCSSAGVLINAQTGVPRLCGPDRQPCPCPRPVAEDSDPTMYYVAGAVVAAGVGLGVGLSGSGSHCSASAVPISGGAIPICQ